MSANSPKQLYRGIRVEFLIAGLTVLLLLPFAGKAFHIDDTMYLWVAEQVRAHPLDFFGFEKPWDGSTVPIYEVNKNPPGISYLIALASIVTGWREVGLHLTFIVPNVLAVLGVFRLARRYTSRAALAVVLAVLTPAFLVSATSLMCEPVLLALYVWSIVMWVDGLDRGDRRLLVGSAFAIGAGIVVKYIAITVIPLLVAYTLVRERRATTRLAYFAIPLAIAGGYDLLSYVLYESSVVQAAIDFALHGTGKTNVGISGPTIFATDVLVTSSFVGACFASAAFLMPWLWNGRIVGVFAALFVVTFLFLLSPLAEAMTRFAFGNSEITVWRVCQLAFWAAAGYHVLFLAVRDTLRHRDAASLLLSLLVMGIFVFSAAVNWTINARALLPMLPAVGILLVRRLDEAEDALFRGRPYIWALAPSALIAIAVAHADYRIAASERQASRDIVAAMQGIEGRTLYYGDRGFAWYMDRAGYTHLETRPLLRIPAAVQRMLDEDPALRIEGVAEAHAGDILAFSDSDNPIEFSSDRATLLKRFQYSQSPVVTTMSLEQAAGFYSYTIGPLPFYLGRTAPREYQVYQFRKDFHGLITAR